MITASPKSQSKLVGKLKIQILDKLTEKVESIDYLGMTLDQKLKWDKHVRLVINKTTTG